MNIAALQLSTLPMSDSKLDYYMRICADKGVKLILLGEYVLNHFFKELEKTSLNMIKEQSTHHLETLKKMAKAYQVTLVAPVIRIEKRKPVKSVVKISPTGSVSYSSQQILIPYEHWNEAKYFGNEAEKIEAPYTFTLEGVRFAVLFGFELHFDLLWLHMQQKKVDVVLMPTASTFDSQIRWREIIKSRAFCNSMYVLRANRVGEYSGDSKVWNFYGESLITTPAGEIENILGDAEELLVTQVDKKFVRDTRKMWGFKTPEVSL